MTEIPVNARGDGVLRPLSIPDWSARERSESPGSRQESPASANRSLLRRFSGGDLTNAAARLAQRRFSEAIPTSPPGKGRPNPPGLTGTQWQGSAGGLQETEGTQLEAVWAESVRVIILDHDMLRRPFPCPMSAQDFALEKEIVVRVEGVEYTGKAYAPQVFRQLRNYLNISDDAFLKSFCPTDPSEGLRAADTSSAIGDHFVSRDGRFMVKVVSAAEAKRFLKVLPHYFRHVRGNRNTILQRIVGFLKLRKPSDMYVLIMSNVFAADKAIHERYNLKGSTVGRAATYEQKAQPGCILKDYDFLTRARKMQIGSERKAELMRQMASDCAFLESVGMMQYSLLVGVHQKQHQDQGQDWSEADTAPSSPAVLGVDAPGHRRRAPAEDDGKDATEPWGGSTRAAQQLETFSLTAPRVAQLSEDEPDARPSQPKLRSPDAARRPWSDVEPTPAGAAPPVCAGLAPAKPDGSAAEAWACEAGDEIYYIGIVNFLHTFDAKKRAESALKGALLNSNTFSCVGPKKYAHRFQKFIETLVE